MRSHLSLWLAVILYVLVAASAAVCENPLAVPLPQGVKAVWDMGKAYRETTPTRQRICINGLWRWQPAGTKSDQPPIADWGYLKVPGPWPGGGQSGQRGGGQGGYPHPSWKGGTQRSGNTAWFQREIDVPKEWAGRRITVTAEYVYSRAVVYVDGTKVGDILYPSGEVDITSACRPGSKQLLSMEVTALPLSEVVAVFSDSNAPRQAKGTVARRGLCGDVYLVGTPSGPRIADVKVDTSVRKGEITFDTALEGLAPDGNYVLRAAIADKTVKVAEFTSRAFKGSDLRDGRIAVTEKWKPEKLWDTITPQNVYEAAVSLSRTGVSPVGGKTAHPNRRDAGPTDSTVLDAALPVRFGFREFWIDGRDFYLNGTRIFLSAIPLDNGNGGPAQATYEAAKATMLRLQSTGINFVYTHNYSCSPGSHASFAEILRAADDVGMLLSLSQPHYGEYDWTMTGADRKNGYARHAEFYVRVAQNHPSVVFYSTSHNGTGYSEDMNPDAIDGIANPRSPRAQEVANRALRAEAIIHRLDPSRVVYHHSSGNLGSMHTSNFYPNWVPIQEMCDWFEHWSTTGVKPVFTCEFGAPFTWDWAVYRGWYKGKREFGSAVVPWEYCLAEWNSQFLGDRAFQISEQEKRNLRWEAKQFREGRVWHRWDYPYAIGARDFDEQYPVMAMYMADNWRAFRTWGMSANSPWQYSVYWKQLAVRSSQLAVVGPLTDNRQPTTANYWENLQRPGYSPDGGGQGSERSNGVPTVAADALVRNNMPLLAYIGGKPAAFTSKDHNFLPGETVEKQLIIINNSRQTVTADCQWSLGLAQAVTGARTATIATGQQERIPLRFSLPAGLAPGKYEIHATVKFSTGETQRDSCTLHVLPTPPAWDGLPIRPTPKPVVKIALFDPKGETGKLLEGMGLKFQPVNADADVSGYDILIVGKAAMTPDGPAPNVAAVSKGLKVIVFEQTADVLEKRFGFRVAEYGLRNVYKRVPDHPALAGLDVEHLRDWRGEATILPPRLKYESNPGLFNGVPVVRWCDIPVTRLWRCGNRGSVASVLIEKPARGNFLPLIDGGYSLQYSPLVEYREGKGMVLFCQMDVTGRTEADPAADRLARNIIAYVSAWKPAASRQALYAGEPAGKNHLEKAGLSVASYQGGKLSSDQVLIAGPGGGQLLSAHAAAIAEWLKAGGHLLAIGLDQADAGALWPKVTMKKAEHIAAYFEPSGTASLLAGIGPADVHNRDPRDFSLVSGGATVVGDGVLAKVEQQSVVFCQLVPWQCDYSKEKHNVKQTFRRSSFLVTRLLGNMGVESATPVLPRFNSPVDATKAEKRWLEGLYLDRPEEWDDPYRFFRW